MSLADEQNLTDSLCILSPIKLRESTFLKLGEATTKRFRLIEDDVDTIYVAQLSIHIPGSDEVIQPSLLRLNAAQNEPFSYVLQLNLNTTSQLFEAILPNLSFHHTYSVQVDISIFELFAVTSAQVAGLAQQIAERDNDTAGGAPSNTKAISEWDRIRAEANPYPTFEPLQPSSRFSSTSTLVSTSSELTDDDHISNQDHTRLRSWLKGHKRSASLVNRVSKRLERVKAKIGTPRSPTQQDVPSKVMKLELDMERWEDEHADAAVKQKNGPGSSWASSVSLGSEMSDVDLDEKLMP